MKIWIDDVRPAPEGWFWCKSVNEAKDFIRWRAATNQSIELLSVDHDAGDYIAGWLRNLGFTVKRVGPSGWHEITWEDNEPLDPRKTWHMMVQRGDRKQCHPEADCLKSGKPAWYLYHWKNDSVQWDYICSCCNEHSKHKTKFCPNCGAKMHMKE